MENRPDQFDKLRALLAWKRHEQPPPGYFQRLPDRVLRRIEAQVNIEQTSSWWSWLIDRFDAKPIVACAYALSVSGLLLGGFYLSRQFEKEVAAASATTDAWIAASPSPTPLFTAPPLTLFPDLPSPPVIDSKPALRPAPASLFFLETSAQLPLQTSSR